MLHLRNTLHDEISFENPMDDSMMDRGCQRASTEAPPMLCVGFVGYIETPKGLRALTSVWAGHISEERSCQPHACYAFVSRLWSINLPERERRLERGEVQSSLSGQVKVWQQGAHHITWVTTLSGQMGHALRVVWWRVVLHLSLVALSPIALWVAFWGDSALHGNLITLNQCVFEIMVKHSCTTSGAEGLEALGAWREDGHQWHPQFNPRSLTPWVKRRKGKLEGQHEGNGQTKSICWHILGSGGLVCVCVCIHALHSDFVLPSST